MSKSELLNQLRLGDAQREQSRGVSVNRSRWPLVGAIAGAVLVAGSAGAWALHAPAAIVVQTSMAIAPSTSDAAGAVLQATGYVTARRQATVSSQVTGTLVEVLIEEGDRVEQGQVLARLESRGQLASMRAAQAGALVADAQVMQLDAQLEQAMRNADRHEQLARKQLVSAQGLDQARSDVKSLAAQLQAARQQTELARAQSDLAGVAVGYTEIRAPFAGVVTRKAAQVGEIVSPSSAGGGFTRSGIGTIVDMDALEVDVDVNEAYIGRVKAGMPAEIVLDAYPEWRIVAHVVAIVPTADRAKATVKVRVGFEVKDARIVPDMGARVSFLDKTPPAEKAAPAGVLVPATAIVQRDGRDVVFVAANGRASRRDVPAGVQVHGSMKLLPSAVAAGETVVISPPAELADGASIEAGGAK